MERPAKSAARHVPSRRTGAGPAICSGNFVHGRSRRDVSCCSTGRSLTFTPGRSAHIRHGGGGAKEAEGSVGSKAWVLCACESRQPTDGAAKCHMRSKYGWRRAKKRAQCHFDRQRSRDVPSVFSFHSPPIPMQTPCGRLASFFWYRKIARSTRFSMSNGRVGGETCAQSQAEGLDSTFGLFNEDF